jgi:hypothetical protein
MTSTTSEFMWIKQLLNNLNITTHLPIKIFYDNQITCHIASNLVFQERTKHIEIDCHFIREKIQSKEIEISFVKSKDQKADIFIKGLDSAPFEDNVGTLGLIDICNLM